MVTTQNLYLILNFVTIFGMEKLIHIPTNSELFEEFCLCDTTAHSSVKVN